MNVQLINWTEDAMDLLLFTKNTRLMTEPGGISEVSNWPPEKKQAELDYMRGTIQSSWEFVDYVFLITGVSRAFTHQLVRTRVGSYAQQSQRTVAMTTADFVMPRSATMDQWEALDNISRAIFKSYNQLIDEEGLAPQDARSILPTNVATNIIAKFNLRTLADMAKVRLCTRTQGEYQDVFRAMRSEVIAIHPWAEPFIRVYCAATGICCFPNYMECPIKPSVFDPQRGGSEGESYAGGRPCTPDEIQEIWQDTRFEATPKSMDKKDA
jgi:flavin-dependent thymidylate synthase